MRPFLRAKVIFFNLSFIMIVRAKELVDDGTIQCIKAAHGDPNRVHELNYHCKDDLTVFYGHDYAAMEGLLAGEDGWLSGFPAVLPNSAADSRMPASQKMWMQPSQPRTIFSHTLIISSMIRSTGFPTGRKSASTHYRHRAWM